MLPSPQIQCQNHRAVNCWDLWCWPQGGEGPQDDIPPWCTALLHQQPVSSLSLWSHNCLVNKAPEFSRGWELVQRNRAICRGSTSTEAAPGSSITVHIHGQNQPHIFLCFLSGIRKEGDAISMCFPDWLLGCQYCSANYQTLECVSIVIKSSQLKKSILLAESYKEFLKEWAKLNSTTLPYKVFHKSF